jgi:DNA primase
MDRLEFPEAVEALASRFGVSIPRRARGPRDDRREKLLEAVAAAHRFYAGELAKPNSKGSAYLAERGVASDLVGKLALGQAPDAWTALAESLAAAYPEPLLIEAGLLQPGQDGKRAYDRFRDRLLFVLRDDRGRPVGFGGRALSPQNEPKYLNSPESPIFQKKRTLYGLSDARDAIRRRERVVLVEGYFDHLALVSAGILETVASMGTALTPEQAEKLHRLAPNVVVCYDGDSAGRAATRAALALLFAQGFAARVARLPQGADPHDVLRAEGPQSLAARIEEAPDALTWLLEGADADPMTPGLTSAAKTERVAAILEILRAIPDAILRHEECARLARHSAIPLEVLWDRIKPVRTRANPPPLRAPGPGTAGNGRVLQGGEIPGPERRILQILLTEPELNPLILGTLKDEFLTHPASRRILTALRKGPRDAEVVDFHGRIADLTEEDRVFVSSIALEDKPAPVESDVTKLLNGLEERYLRRQNEEYQLAIQSAAESNSAELESLIQVKEANARRIQELAHSRRLKGN